MAGEKEKVFIIILNFNGKKDTLDCLETIRELVIKDWELGVIVVDNNSRDGSVKAIKKKFPSVIIIENKRNLGFSEGNNCGLRYALKNDADYCLVLNNDTFVEKNLLIQLIKAAKKEKKNGILSPKIYFAPGFEYHKNRYQKSERGKVIWYAGGLMDWRNILASHRGVDEVDKGQYQQTQETEFCTGCCFLIKKEVLEKVGLFDKKYFLYWEDNDLSQRAKKAGFKCLFVPQAIIWHKNAGSSRSGSPLQDYYLTRNRLLFALKFASLRSKIALLKESVIELFQGRKWEKRGIIDFYFGCFKQGSYQ